MVHSEVSTTAASDRVVIPVRRSSATEINAPAICASPRMNRTTVHTRLSPAGTDVRGCPSGRGSPQARGSGESCPGRERHAHHDRSPTPHTSANTLHSAHRAGGDLWRESDEPSDSLNACPSVRHHRI